MAMADSVKMLDSFDFSAIPSLNKATRRQRIILQGTVSSPINPPKGCRFNPRCFARIGEICEKESPPFFTVGEQRVACWKYQQHTVTSG